jgi:hypothetical protein
MAPRNTEVLAKRFRSLGLADLRVILAALDGPSCTSERASDLYYAVKRAIDARQARRRAAA